MEYSAIGLPLELSESNRNEFETEVLRDYYTCLLSREMSLLARKEVLTGKAKFGIVGDGKELAQVAMARAFKKGDFKTGYYRDQTFVLAKGLLTIEDFFSQIYADPENDRHSKGRQMSSHFATKFIDEDDQILPLANLYNVSADMAPTGGQVARALGHALGSKLFKKIDFQGSDRLTNGGDEVAFCTIGDASTSEGAFWETMNAAAVQRVPLAVAVWDDGYGISVPTSLQTVKGSISRALEGFLLDENDNGMRIYCVKGWDYVDLVKTFEEAIEKCRDTHIPCLIHVQDITQPQGHSTSGSHERYKTSERLQWEREMDCIVKMEEWMLQAGLISVDEIEKMHILAKEEVKIGRDSSWKKSCVKANITRESIKNVFGQPEQVVPEELSEIFKTNGILSNTEIIDLVKRYYVQLNNKGGDSQELTQLADIIAKFNQQDKNIYQSHLYSENKRTLNFDETVLDFESNDEKIPAYQLINKYFDQLFMKDHRMLAFGEDVGQIGDVNQGFSGLQSKHSEYRIFDCGIREWTIVGQAIGLAQRGFRPIAEIQYLDYLPYAMSPLMDDLATLRYRSGGLQSAPVIIRTRGHRLEGIWHAGSPMGMMLTSMPGIHIVTPRNITQAIGFYNTIIQGDDPAIVIECLNGYRLREKVPSNLLNYSIPLGIPETLQLGNDITVVTYGSCVRIAEEAIEILLSFGISVELIDARTLQPFDTTAIIAESVKKTSKIVFMDEDIPGGATAYMMRAFLERDKGFQYLDAAPATLSAKENRTPYGSDGDYLTKPQTMDLVALVYSMMQDSDPAGYPIDFSLLLK